MIELTWGLIRDPNFNQAMVKLINSPLEFKDSYQISRIASAVETEQKEADKLFQALLKKFTEVDEKGNYKVKEEAKEEWKKQTTDFMATKFLVKKEKLDLEKLSSIKFSASEIMALEPLVAEPQETKTPKLVTQKTTKEIQRGLRN